MLQRTFHLARYIVAFMLIVVLGSVAAYTQGSGQTVTASDGVYSITVPAGWKFEPLPVNGLINPIALGSSQGTVDIIKAIFTGSQAAGSSGIGGLIAEFDLSREPGVTAAQAAEGALQAAAQNLIGNDLILGAPAAHTFGGKLNGYLMLTKVGYAASVYDDAHLLFVMLLTDDVATNQGTMDAVLDTIQINGAGTVSPAHPIAPTTPEATSSETTTWRSSDNRLSVDLPPEWNVLDNVADANTMAYGDTLEAAQSRLASARPDLATKTPISGNGGLVILYPAAQFNVNPQNPDLTALMTQALAQLKGQGYTTDAAIPLDNIPGGLYAYISGDEVGYLALIPFGDQIAYVTATGTRDSFDAAEDTLTAIIDSVHSPAVPELSGLGGLGGLQNLATEESSGGLGGLTAPQPTATTAPRGLSGNETPAAPNETPDAISTM